jgi:hypothetical protein
MKSVCLWKIVQYFEDANRHRLHTAVVIGRSELFMNLYLRLGDHIVATAHVKN